MLNLYLKIKLGDDRYAKLMKSTNIKTKILRAEKAFKQICMSIRPRTIITENNVSVDYLLPIDLAQFARYGNLIYSDFFSDDRYEDDACIAKREYKFPFNDEEFEDDVWKGEDTDLAKQTAMKVDDWILFWEKVNKLLPDKEKIQMVAITKEPMLLSNLGGILSKDGKVFYTLKDNENNAWELAYLLGYKTDLFKSFIPQTKKISELRINSYLVKGNSEVN